MNPLTNVEYLYNMSEDPLVMRVMPRSVLAVRALIEGLSDMADGLEETAAALEVGEPEERQAADDVFHDQLREVVDAALETAPAPAEDE